MATSGPQGNNGSKPPDSNPAPIRSLDPAALLSRLWQQSLPAIRERVRRLDRLAEDALVAGELSAAARTEAADLAHKLAGSLGMFGYPKGTEIARQMEHLLEGEVVLDSGQLHQLSIELRAVLPL